MKAIYVYQDYVHNNGVLFRRLVDTFGQETVRYCDATDILKGCLSPDLVSMFVMPGGADLFYCEKLNGAGNAAIRSYVEQGGTYLGICAGAYYACSRIEWAKNDPDHAICGDRELSFFAGTATGPVYDWLEECDITKSWDNVVVLETMNGTSSALYSAGPVFIPDNDSSHTTLARYKELPGQPLALVDITVGKGRAILSSAHIEFSKTIATPDLLEQIRTRARVNSYAWSEKVCADFVKAPPADLWDRYITPLAPSSAKEAA